MNQIEEVVALKAEIEELVSSLNRYGHHWTDCPAGHFKRKGDSTPKACECGFSEVLMPRLRAKAVARPVVEAAPVPEPPKHWDRMWQGAGWMDPPPATQGALPNGEDD